MKITELLGPRAMTFMDWFGWLHGTEEGRKLINRYQERYGGISEEKAALMMIHAARAVLGGQMSINVVVRPEPPFNGWAPGNYSGHCRLCKEKMIADKLAMVCESCAYQNWKPLFLGFETIDMPVLQGTTKVTALTPDVGYYHDSERWWIKNTYFKAGDVDSFIRLCKGYDVEILYNPEYLIKT